VLGLEKEHVTFQIPGVNHFVWLTEFSYKGENAFPILDKWIKEKSQDYWAGHKHSALSPKTVDLYKIFGAVPIGDTCHWTGGNGPYWYHSDPEEAERWGESDALPFWEEYVDTGRQNARKIKAASENMSAKVSDVFPGTSSETFIQLVESIACDIPRVMPGNNIPNTDRFIEGLPENIAVEVPTLVNRCGIQGIKTNGMPRPIIAHILHERVATIEMELEAYNTGRRDLLLQLILMDRQTKSRKQAEQFLAEILALPYHADMRKHYR
jgi:alpha-galactosidase